jgi:pilus assembly protein CpaB
MGAVRIIVLVVAAVAAIGLALVVKTMAGRHAAPPAAVAAVKPTVQVLVAKRDLSIGARVAQGDVGWQAWPAESVNPAFITDGTPPSAPPATPAGRIGATAAQAATAAASAVTGGPMAEQRLMGDVVREPILAGEPLVERKLVKGGAGGYMSVVLQPGMRAVAVPVKSETGAGGFILPGDRVDVVLSRKGEGGGTGGPQPMAKTVLRNIRVLAIDQKPEPDKNSRAMIGQVATLETSASDVELLLKSQAQGELSLILRSYADVGGPSGTLQAAMGPSTEVEIIRAGHVSQVAAR